MMVGFLKGMPGSRAPFVFTLPSSTPEGMVEELDPFLAIARWASGCQEREEDLFRGQLPGARHGDEAWSKVFSDAVRLVVDHLGWKVPPNTKVSGKSGRKAFASIAAEVSCFETKICDWGQWSVTTGVWERDYKQMCNLTLAEKRWALAVYRHLGAMDGLPPTIHGSDRFPRLQRGVSH